MKYRRAAVALFFLLLTSQWMIGQSDQKQPNQTSSDQGVQAQGPTPVQVDQTQPPPDSTPPATSADDSADKGKPKHAGKNNVDAIGNRSVGNGLSFYSIEKEIRIGKQYAQEVEASVKLVQDPVINEYVNRIGQNLVRNSDAKVPFTIKVIDTDVVNAMALPGGFFYVNSGLILAADEEAELAGVMSHEIAHVAARHWAHAMTKGQLLNIASIPLIFVGGGIGYAVRSAAGIGLPMTFLTFQRSQEAEADYLGVQYMYKAGYDPTAFVDFFEKIQTLEKRKPGTVSKLFSTHPPTDDRIQKSQKQIADLKARPEYVVTTSEFNDVKSRLAMLENQRRPDKTNEDPNKPTLRRNPNSNAPIEDETDPSKKSKGDDSDRPKLKRRPSDTGDSPTSDPNSTGPN